MTRDTETVTYRGHKIQVTPARIVVPGPGRTTAEFTTMAAARRFIRLLTKPVTA